MSMAGLLTASRRTNAAMLMTIRRDRQSIGYLPTANSALHPSDTQIASLS